MLARNYSTQYFWLNIPQLIAHNFIVTIPQMQVFHSLITENTESEKRWNEWNQISCRKAEQPVRLPTTVIRNEV